MYSTVERRKVNRERSKKPSSARRRNSCPSCSMPPGFIGFYVVADEEKVSTLQSSSGRTRRRPMRSLSLGLGLGSAMVDAAVLAQGARVPRWAPQVLSGVGITLAVGLLNDIRRRS